MSSSTTGRPKRTQSSSRKSARSGGRPNRSQIRAAEIRTAANADALEVVAAATAPAAGARIRRPVPRVFSLSRSAELTYIRNDLRRLIYTAGVLFVLMMILLFIIG